MSVTKTKSTAPQEGTPAPTPSVDPAVLTPGQNASFDSERRRLLSEWRSRPMADEGGGETPEPEAIAQEPEDPVEVVDEVDEVDAGQAAVTPREPAVEIDEPEVPTPTPEEEAVELSGEPEEARPPKPYQIRQGEDEVDLPEDLTFTYKADGSEKTRTLDEIIQFAQYGENYDRRSRELVQRQRDQEVRYTTAFQRLEQQYQQANSELIETARRLAEDEDFREEFIDEYEKLISNPEELELRAKARRAEELEEWFRHSVEQKRSEWQKQVWSTVDTIIGEQLSDYDAELAPDLARRVRDRFVREYNTRGEEVLRESFVVDLVREERSLIDRAVERERAKVAQLVPAERARAVVQERNKIADRTLRRETQARRVPTSSGPAPTPQKAPPPIRTMADAQKALKEWARS